MDDLLGLVELQAPVIRTVQINDHRVRVKILIRLDGLQQQGVVVHVPDGVMIKHNFLGVKGDLGAYHQRAEGQIIDLSC